MVFVQVCVRVSASVVLEFYWFVCHREFANVKELVFFPSVCSYMSIFWCHIRIYNSMYSYTCREIAFRVYGFANQLVSN